MGEETRSILFVENLDLVSPLGCTVPYYLTTRLSDKHEVHVICRARSHRGERDQVPGDVVMHRINSGEVPVVSGILFVILSSLYSVVLSAIYRFDIVYVFQYEMIQGWLGSRVGGSKLVIGLQAVPVRQDKDFQRSGQGSQSVIGSIKVTLYLAYARVIRNVLVNADEIICLTDGIRQITERVYSIDLSDSHTIGMGVDTEKFSNEGAREGESSVSDGWTLTYVGTIHSTRGLDHVIEAISETEYDVELQIAGSGPDDYVASLKTKARELGVSDQITWLGLLSHEEVPQLLWSTDIAVCPLPDIESYQISFPAKSLEYMAAGCLVIATDISPHQRLIEDEKNGFLYDGEKSDFVRSLHRCIENSDRHRSIRKEARKTANDYDWDVIVGKHERILQ